MQGKFLLTLFVSSFCRPSTPNPPKKPNASHPSHNKKKEKTSFLMLRSLHIAEHAFNSLLSVMLLFSLRFLDGKKKKHKKKNHPFFYSFFFTLFYFLPLPGRYHPPVLQMSRISCKINKFFINFSKNFWLYLTFLFLLLCFYLCSFSFFEMIYHFANVTLPVGLRIC